MASSTRRITVLAAAAALIAGGVTPADGASVKPPGKPRNVRLTAGINEISVAWSRAKTNRREGAATSYTATAVPNVSSASVRRSGTKRCTVAAPTQTCVIAGLVNGRQYKVQVVANRTVGHTTKRSGATDVKRATPQAGTLTFDPQNGTSTSEVSFGASTVLSEPTTPVYAGYTFLGWSTSSAGGAETLVTWPYTPIDHAERTLYGQWAAEATLTFDPQNGTSTSEVSFSDTTVLDEPTTPTYTGRTFLGWFTDPLGGSDTQVTFPYTPVDHTERTLYAQWSVRITGTITGGTATGLSVVTVLNSGRTFSSGPLLVDGAFAIDLPVPNGDRANSTMHILAVKGTYLGPVMLDDAGHSGLGTTAASVNPIALGNVELKDSSTWALVASTPASLGTRQITVVSGKPIGAGNAGFATPPAPGATVRGAATGPIVRIAATEADCAAISESFALGGSACWTWITANITECSSATLADGLTVVDLFGTNPTCANAIVARFSGGGGGGGGGGGSSCDGWQPGADDDADGLVNAIDVDDDNDGTVDMADPDANNACTIEPYKGIRLRLGQGAPLNLGNVDREGHAVAGGATLTEFNSQVNDAVSGDAFAISYFVYDPRFFPGATQVEGKIPAVWATCPGVVWCDKDSGSKALLGTNIEEKNAADSAARNTAAECSADGFFLFRCNKLFDALVGGVDIADSGSSSCSTLDNQSMSYKTPCWSDLTTPLRFGDGTQDCQTSGLPLQPSYNPAATYPVVGGKSNYLWQAVCDQGQDKGIRQVIGASLSPNLGAVTPATTAFTAMSALDIVLLNYPTGPNGATVGSVATTLGAFPITTPMVKTFGVVAGSTTSLEVDYNAQTPEADLYGASPNVSDGRAVILGAGEKLGITTYRPQRLAFPGETDATGYHDLHGLSYGVQIEIGSSQLGCGASTGGNDQWLPQADSAYSDFSTDFDTASNSDEGAAALTPIKDKGADSPSEAPGVNTVSFTVDIIKCIQDRLDWVNYHNSSALTGADLEVPAESAQDGSASGWVSGTALNPLNHGEGSCIMVTLAARGEGKTGGTDSATQQFCLQFKAGAFTPPPAP